ncbi:AAA family ATPase [Aliiroseovarius sp. 2305UL8-7]|uniref:AAA family ATPase n=1 Tax=Aliiroseovarius conchicola TaxID=3121637 RepID=UPI00352746A3
MKRVMVIGQPGSGKSTLARELGKRTGLPVIHIDKIHWMPGWVERDREEKTRLCREVHARAQWIFEGGHSVTWPERLSRCDTLVWLDVPLGLRVWRVFWRTFKDYGRSRVDLPDDCPERFSFEFYRYIWKTRHSAKRNIEALIATALDKRIVKLTGQAEIARFLEDSSVCTGAENHQNA